MSYNEVTKRGTCDFPIELYHVTEHNPKYNMAHHWHSDIEIIRVLKGTLCLSLNNYDYTLKVGDVVFVNSEVVHGAIPNDCVYECIVFSPDGFASKPEDWQGICDELMSHELYITEYFEAGTTVAKKAHELFDELCKSREEYSRLSCIGALFCLFGEIVRSDALVKERSSTSGGFYRNEHKLKKVLTFIRSNYDSPITLQDMAQICEMSPKYFCSYFKKITKMSPTEYLMFYRVERCARMLLKTDTPITEIAYSGGFSDLSYFIKVFKKQMGMSPGKFRKWSRMQ